MSYSQVSAHRRMLLDDRRNGAYARAIRSAVNPQSVVMDLGAGLGIHGLLAAAAGARRVYLVEPESVVVAALEAARASGLPDRIVVVRERIEDAQLPEQVDVIASALTGNLLFSEDLLPSLYHARDRYLREGGRLIPDRAELWMAPCAAPAVHAEFVAAWQTPVMGLDYGFAARCAANDLIWPTREQFETVTLLTAGDRVASVDLQADHTLDCDSTVDTAIAREGLCHGLTAWIRLRVGAEWLSSSPEAPPVHWSPAIFPIDPPLPLRRGEVVRLSLRRPRHGEWTWAVQAEQGTRRHSTFLAQAETAQELARVAGNSAPGLSARGMRMREILNRLAEGESVEAIASQVALGHRVAPGQVLLEVQAIAKRYGGRA